MGRNRLRLRLPISLILILIHYFLQSVVSEDNESNKYNPIIIDHSLEEGINLTSTISFPVFIENEVKPDLVQWELRTGVDSVLFQDVSDSILLLDGNQSRSVWTFEISIDAGSVSPCSCILSIKARESELEPIQHYQSVFIKHNDNDAETSEVLPPTVYLPDNIHDNWATVQDTSMGFQVHKMVRFQKFRIH